MKYSILGCIIHLFLCNRSKQTHFLDVFKKMFMKIDKIEAVILKIEVPGSKNTFSAQNFTFSARW